MYIHYRYYIKNLTGFFEEVNNVFPAMGQIQQYCHLALIAERWKWAMDRQF